MLGSVTKLPWLNHASFLKEGAKVTPKVGVVDVALFSALSNKEFELLIKKLFLGRGYTIIEDNENIIDLTLMQNNQLTFVQFYQWQQNSIEVSSIEYLFSAMQSCDVKHGIVMSTGVFTEEAIEFSLGKKILLVNGQDLSQMVEALMLSESEPESTGNESAQNTRNADEFPDAIQEVEPLCPVCHHKMIKRVAKKGKNAGNTFWGCSQFPKCRGVVHK